MIKKYDDFMIYLCYYGCSICCQMAMPYMALPYMARNERKP